MICLNEEELEFQLSRLVICSPVVIVSFPCGVSIKKRDV